jgi:hypothetical protein
MRLEELGQLKKSNDPVGNVTLDLKLIDMIRSCVLYVTSQKLE